MRRLDHLVANPPPKVGTTSRVRATDGQEPVDPPQRARFASEDRRARARAFAHYAGAKPETAGAAMPRGSSSRTSAPGGMRRRARGPIHRGIARRRDRRRLARHLREFKTMCGVIEGGGRRGAGEPARRGDGARPAGAARRRRQRAHLAPRRRRHRRRHSWRRHTAGDDRSARLMTMEAWNGMLLDAGLLAPAGRTYGRRRERRGDDARGSVRRVRAGAGAGSIARRAIAHVPDFSPASPPSPGSRACPSGRSRAGCWRSVRNRTGRASGGCRPGLRRQRRVL